MPLAWQGSVVGRQQHYLVAVELSIREVAATAAAGGLSRRPSSAASAGFGRRPSSAAQPDPARAGGAGTPARLLSSVRLDGDDDEDSSYCGGGALDGAGNLLFLRAVHPYERAEMTTVFASFRDVTQVAPPLLCSLLLAFFALPSVFVASGTVMLASAVLTARIPRRL